MLPKDPTDTLSLYNLALTFVPNVGTKTIRTLIAKFETAEQIFKASQADLKQVIGEVKAKSFLDTTIFEQAEKELLFTKKYQIDVLFLNDANYPKRLLQCDDAPCLLYYKGNADLNADKYISIIGTRKNTDYGLRATERILEDLKNVEGLIIVSGLAAGIDTIAHKAALKNNLQTVGVLGHSLEHIYPSSNKSLAGEMIQHGGLLSEFPSETKPARQNFPVRNRIVAGLSDLTIVVESDVKGGAMITAYLTISYNRELATIPGRIFDNKSSGPNQLIKKNMAAPITCGADVLELMNWEATTISHKAVQQKIFNDLSEEEKKIVGILKEKDKMHADELMIVSGFDTSKVAAILLQLEMQGVVKTLPGKLYRLE
jgi:DNA processing protein